jgi:hypothetical protein
VGVVDDKIAGLQRQWVDFVSFAGGASFRTGEVADAIAGQVGFGDDHQWRIVAFGIVRDDAGVVECVIQGDVPWLRRAGFGGHVGGDARLGEALLHAFDGCGCRRDECCGSPIMRVRLQGGHQRFDGFEITVRCRRQLGLKRQEVPGLVVQGCPHARGV